MSELEKLRAGMKFNVQNNYKLQGIKMACEVIEKEVNKIDILDCLEELEERDDYSVEKFSVNEAMEFVLGKVKHILEDKG